MKAISAAAFIEALEYPTAPLANALGGGKLRLQRNEEKQPILQRRSTLLEACAANREESLLISLPLNEEALSQCRQTAHFIRRAQSPHLSRYTLLTAGAQFGRPTQHHDLVLEHIPPGERLEQILREGCEAHKLLPLLDRLEADFARIGFAHNNLKPENILLTTEGNLLVIRPHLATFDGPSEQDREAFKALRSLIIQADTTPWLQAIEKGSAIEPHPPKGAKWPASEGLFCVREGRKYGYKEGDGEWVIPPRFYQAENFREGRAEVQASTGAGVIDKAGNYILSPHYEMVEYDENKGLIRARKEGVWYHFDYMGEPLPEPPQSDESKQNI